MFLTGVCGLFFVLCWLKFTVLRFADFTSASFTFCFLFPRISPVKIICVARIDGNDEESMLAKPENSIKRAEQKGLKIWLLTTIGTVMYLGCWELADMAFRAVLLIVEGLNDKTSDSLYNPHYNEIYKINSTEGCRFKCTTTCTNGGSHILIMT